MQATPLRVIVAEEDDRLAERLTALLSGDGRFVIVGRARTGDEAIELTGERRPDIVVTELDLPGCDGVEATRLIRALNPDQHVVVYTRSADFGDAARAQEAGAFGFLQKDAVALAKLADALEVLHRNYRRRRNTVER